MEVQYHQHVQGAIGESEGPVVTGDQQVLADFRGERPDNACMIAARSRSTDQAGQFDGAVGVAPLVTVLGIELHLGAIDHQGRQRIDDRGARIGAVIDGR